MDWDERADAAIARYRGGEARGPRPAPAHAARRTRRGRRGSACSPRGRSDDAAVWLHCAAERYRESWPDAPPDSWGRPIGAMKALLLAGDDASARGELGARRGRRGRGVADRALRGDAGAARARRRRARPGSSRRRSPAGTTSRRATSRADASRAIAGLRRRRVRRAPSSTCSARSRRATEFLEDVPVAEHGARAPDRDSAEPARTSPSEAARRRRASAARTRASPRPRGRARRSSIPSPARTRLPGVSRLGSPANERATASALSAPATRNSTSRAAHSTGSVSVIRSTNGSSFASTPTTRRSDSSSVGWFG